MNTEMDFLIVGNFLYDKSKQLVKIEKIEFLKD